MNDYLITLLKSQTSANLMDYVKELVRPTALEDLNESIMCCQKCHKTCLHKQKIVGNAHAPILMLLPYPTENDAAILNYLHTLLSHFHLTSEQVALAYTVWCMPCDDLQHFRPPFQEEVALCLPFLKQALDIIEPKAVFCMSSLATQVFTKQHFADCLKTRGYFNQMTVFTAIYPQFILDLQAEKNSLAEGKEAHFYTTFEKMLDYLRKTYPELKL